MPPVIAPPAPPKELAAGHAAALKKSLAASEHARVLATNANVARVQAQIRKARAAETARIEKAARAQANAIEASLKKPARGTWAFEGPALSTATIDKLHARWELGETAGGVVNSFELVNVVPNAGYPGDEVVVTGTGLAADASLLRTFFCIAPATAYPPDGLVAQGRTLGVTASGAAEEIRIRVPDPQPAYSGPGALSPFCGNVYVLDEGAGEFTNRIPFTYLPKPVPLITSVRDGSTGAAEIGCESLVRIEGNNFGDPSLQDSSWTSPDGKKHSQGTSVTLNGVPLDIQYLSDTLILAAVATDAPVVQTCVLVVTRRLRDWTLQSNAVGVTLLPSTGYISSISPQPLVPGQPVTITGEHLQHGFDELHFLVGATDAMVSRADVNVVTDSMMVTVVPDVSSPAFSQDTIGYVYMKGRTQTDPVSCHFAPKLVSMLLPLTALPNASDFQFAGNDWEWQIRATEIFGMHFSAYIYGFKKDDLFFLSTCLKNNWIVEDIVFTPHESDHASIAESHVGTDRLSTKVHWWVDAFGSVDYLISWKVKGPEGVPCF